MNTTIASPTLIAFLLRQTGTEQVPFAKLLNTSQPRISRVARGHAELTQDEWERGASKLALGEPATGAVPVWIVTCFHASGELDPPPLDAEGKLAVFTIYRYARAVVGHLRDVADIGTAYAVPAWPKYIEEQLKDRGTAATGLRRFNGLEDEVGNTITDWLPSLVDGFVAEQRALGWAGYTT